MNRLVTVIIPNFNNAEFIIECINSVINQSFQNWEIIFIDDGSSDNSKEKLNTSRYSIPFFMHPKPQMDLTCLDSCIDKDNPKSFDDMTAGEFLEQRLKEIGLKK